MSTATRKSKAEGLATYDPVWAAIRAKAAEQAEAAPFMAGVLNAVVIGQQSLESALGIVLSEKLATGTVGNSILRDMVAEAYSEISELGRMLRADIMAVVDRDPATDCPLETLLFLKGFQSLQTYRVAHWLWQSGRTFEARFFQSRMSEVFGVDIHPAARIGCGIMIDHGSSIVIGETAVVEDNVSMLQGVTLGGTGKEHGDRHPKVRKGVLIGAGAKILGNLEIGENSKIASGSVVLKDVPPGVTVAGVPAKIVGSVGDHQPSRDMDQTLTADAEFDGDFTS